MGNTCPSVTSYKLNIWNYMNVLVIRNLKSWCHLADYSLFTYTLCSPNNGCYWLYFQKMSKIPSLMELRSLSRFRTSCLKNYSCVMCGKVFERERYLKDHIHSVHMKSLVCDFCDHRVASRRRKRLDEHMRKVAPRRRKRLDEHMRKRHNFPAPPCLFSGAPACC